MRITDQPGRCFAVAVLAPALLAASLALEADPRRHGPWVARALGQLAVAFFAYEALFLVCHVPPKVAVLPFGGG
jgi:hypothetical protein